MRLSYSLLEHYQTCEYRTKVLDFERCKPAGSNVSDAFRSLVGQAAHAGQAAAIHRAVVSIAIQKVVERYQGGYPDPWCPQDVMDRAARMVERWRRSVPGWSPDWCQPVYVNSAPVVGALVDRRLVWTLPEPLGIFTECVIAPDLVCAYRPDPVSGQSSLRLYDWKWVGALDGEVEDSAYRYDLQSAIYQYVLYHGFDLDVRYHGIVQGLIEEPTAFKTNKDGTVSTRAVRNSWEEYVRACELAGHAPNEAMRDRCLPTFQHHMNYRSRKEVDAIWAQTVVPLALKISCAAAKKGWGGNGFVRRMSKFLCARCPVREDCQLGQLGQHADRAWNTIYLEG